MKIEGADLTGAATLAAKACNGLRTTKRSMSKRILLQSCLPIQSLQTLALCIARFFIMHYAVIAACNASI